MLLLALQTAVTWTVLGGGSIAPNGLYTAPSAPGGTVRVVARAAGAADTSLVTVAPRAAVARAAPAPEASVAPGIPGVPFGMFEQPVSATGGLYTLSVMPQHMRAIPALPELARKGAKIILNVTNSGNCAKDLGAFSLELWKTCFRQFAYDDPQARELITEAGDNGTLLAIYLLDEPNHPRRWGPRGTVTQAMVEEMAAYSKSLFPRIPTVVRASPEWLAEGNVTYRALDGAWAQYRRNRGPIEEYIRKHTEKARELGLCLVFSLNIIDGGTTDAADPMFSGWDSGRKLYEMSPAEIISYGLPMVQAQPWAVGAWDYRPAYLSKPGVREAMDSLGRAAQKATWSCSRATARVTQSGAGTAH
jgi:hypothetical protein